MTPPVVRRSVSGLVPVAGLALLAALGPVLGSCAVNPATGERQLMLVGREQEIAMGRQGAAQVRGTIGLYEENDLGRYVEEMGLAMARGTERPDLPWTFGVVDDPTVNAFALPGGFIYFTRGILAHFNSEAELAAVMGHEIGHVTARHSANQMSRQQLAQLGLGLGSILSEDVARFSGVVGAGLGVLFLKYSREDERQADRLGLRYMLSRDYAPAEAVDVFRMLQRQSEMAGGSGVPGWLSTHPSPEDRIEQMRRMIDTLSRERVREASVGRERYLERIEGMAFGPDPRNGFLRDGSFLHPGREFRVEVPEGWDVEHMSRMMNAVSPQEDAAVRLSFVDTTSHVAAARAFFSPDDVQAVSSRETRINEFPAVLAEFRARSESGVLRGRVAFVSDGPHVYRLLGFTLEERFRDYDYRFRRFLDSFRRLDDPEVLSVEPMRIQLITVPGGATVGAVHEDRGSPVSAERLALMNAVEVDELLTDGRVLKWVVGELPPEMERRESGSPSAPADVAPPAIHRAPRAGGAGSGARNARLQG